MNPGITKCDGDPSTRSNGPRRSRSARAPAATIVLPSTTSAPSGISVWEPSATTGSPRTSVRPASCAPATFGSGGHDHAVEDAQERLVRVVQDLGFVDRRERAVAVHDLPVDDGGVDRAPVGGE